MSQFEFSRWKGTASQAAEKVFLRVISGEKRLQVIESSFVEMAEITKLVPFSAACSAVPKDPSWNRALAQAPRLKPFSMAHVSPG